MIQLLKSQGFDRAKPSTVDTISDLYIKFLNLLVSEVIKLAGARTDNDDLIALQDITLAFSNLGIIKPNDKLDVYDENSEIPNDKGVKSLKEWCLNNTQLNNSRKVAIPSINMLNISNNNISPASNGLNNNTSGNTNNPLLPINSNKQSKQVFAIPEYINPLQPSQQEELEKEKGKEKELIEELINNGDTDDWIRLLITRQKLNIYNRKHNKDVTNSTSTTFAHSGQVPANIPSIPDIKSLPNIYGLKYSILNDTIKASSSGFENKDINLANTEIKSHNEVLPSLSETDVGYTDVNPGIVIEADRNISSDGNSTLHSRIALLMGQLPIMRPDTKLDNISLSYENQDFDSNEDDIQNDFSKINNDDSMELENNELQLTGNNSSNIKFDEYGDMDNTFQRRASLDYGDSSML